MAEAHYNTNSQDRISEKLCGERDVGPTYGFTASPEVGPGVTIGTLQTGYLVYRLQAKTKGKACTHTLPRATTAPKPASLLREGSDAATYPEALEPASSSRRGPTLPCFLRLRTLHIIQEESDVVMRPSALDPASPSRRALALTRVHWLRTTSHLREVGSDAYTCHMALRRS
jgi:hypothetical protein